MKQGVRQLCQTRGSETVVFYCLLRKYLKVVKYFTGYAGSVLSRYEYCVLKNRIIQGFSSLQANTHFQFVSQMNWK